MSSGKWTPGAPPKPGPCKVRLGGVLETERTFTEDGLVYLSEMNRTLSIRVEHWTEGEPAVLDVEAAWENWWNEDGPHTMQSVILSKESFVAGWAACEKARADAAAREAARPSLEWRDGPPTQPGLYVLETDDVPHYRFKLIQWKEDDIMVGVRCRLGPLPEPQ